MKKIFAILATALLCSCSSTAQKDESADNNNDPKVLVAYFSVTGTTEGVAKEIADATSGTLYAIQPETPYTDADLDWHNQQSRSSIEMTDSTSRPALGSEVINASEYDVIFLGYPIWWDQSPRIINTWIESQNLEGKKVIPFATSGSSAIDNSAKQLQNQYPKIDWQQGKRLNDKTGLKDWATSQL